MTAEPAKPTKRAPTKRAAPKPKPDLTLVKPEPKIVMKDSLTPRFYEPVYLHRFLFENGDVVDVHATRDDSRLRDALLASRKIHSDRIAGSSRLNFVGYADMENYTEL